MKLVIDVKLPDSNKCLGCPCLDTDGYEGMYPRCNLGFWDSFDNREQDYEHRTKECIEKFGE